MELKNRLQELLDMLDITAADMSHATGIPKSSLSMWLSGKRTMRLDKIGIICDHYHVDPSWLMGFPVPMNKNTDDEIKFTHLMTGERTETLSRLEAKVIDAYRDLDVFGKVSVLNALGLHDDADAIKQETGLVNGVSDSKTG